MSSSPLAGTSFHVSSVLRSSSMPPKGCTYCLQLIKWDHHRTRATKDHFFPKSKKKMLMGAKTSFVICCQPCNSRKSDKVFSSIEEVREFIRSRKKALRRNIDGN